MKHIIDVLQAIAPITHWTVLPERNATGEALTLPPFIAWTFRHPTEELAQYLRRSISSFEGPIAWELLTVGERWKLTPAKLREVSQRDGCEWGLLAAAQLKGTDPDFGRRANAELSRLADHIEHQMLHSTLQDAITAPVST